mmetsp:Transcript_166424/g.404405  ORF Transcript_166424/g.404405 Transcript_166424/m.404405 type:complete len:382 (+) Transcript_166424:75-1220(+)
MAFLELLTALSLISHPLVSGLRVPLPPVNVDTKGTEGLLAPFVDGQLKCDLGGRLTCTAVGAPAFNRVTPPGPPGPPSMELEVRHGETVIKKFFGRLGNRLLHLTLAILLAEEFGHETVRLPIASSLSPLLGIEILELPTSLHLKRRGKTTSFGCSTMDDTRWQFQCHGANKGEFRRVMTRYLVPLMTNETKTACAKERSSFNGLTVHLRSEDLMWSNHAQARFAPCSFFDKVIHRFDYQAVRIITQPGEEHPCIAELRRRHPKVNVSRQSKSVVKDFCALASARDLAVGSFSTFSLAAELLSDQVANLFLPGDCTCGNATDGVAEPPFAVKTWCYEVEGLLTERSDSDKRDYLLDTPASSIKEAGVCDETQQPGIDLSAY